jgi:uncharacterized protein YigA (DUF484 family)
MPDLVKHIQAEEVAEYLNSNREFFHVFPDLLNELTVSHPRTGKTVSLLERQVVQLREQRDALKIEVDALKDAAGTNGLLLHKVYQLTNELLATETEQQAVEVVYERMQNLFEVEHVALMSWEMPLHNIEGINQLGMSQTWAQTLKETLQVATPVCGLLEDDWQKGLFSTSQRMESVCLIPLGKHKIWGVLALGATSNRFSPELGTYFLEIMGNMITARLNRLF